MGELTLIRLRAIRDREAVREVVLKRSELRHFASLRLPGHINAYRLSFIKLEDLEINIIKIARSIEFPQSTVKTLIYLDRNKRFRCTVIRDNSHRASIP